MEGDDLGELSPHSHDDESGSALPNFFSTNLRVATVMIVIIVANNISSSNSGIHKG